MFSFQLYEKVSFSVTIWG